MNHYEDRGSIGRNPETACIPGQADDRKLFVGGLGRQTTAEEVREYFSKFGEVDSVIVKTDPITGRSRGFAFVVFSDIHTIYKLLDGEHYINDRRIVPKPVTPKTKPAKLFVGGLTPNVSIGEIRKYFSQYGHILGIQAPINRFTNARKPFCFVTFSDSFVAEELLKEPVQYIKGAAVEIREARLNPMISNVPGGRRPIKKPKIEYGPSFEYTVDCVKSATCDERLENFAVDDVDDDDDDDDDVFTGISTKSSRRNARKKQAAAAAKSQRH